MSRNNKGPPLPFLNTVKENERSLQFLFFTIIALSQISPFMYFLGISTCDTEDNSRNVFFSKDVPLRIRFYLWFSVFSILFLLLAIITNPKRKDSYIMWAPFIIASLLIISNSIIYWFYMKKEKETIQDTTRSYIEYSYITSLILLVILVGIKFI